MVFHPEVVCLGVVGNSKAEPTREISFFLQHTHAQASLSFGCLWGSEEAPH